MRVWRPDRRLPEPALLVNLLLAALAVTGGLLGYLTVSGSGTPAAASGTITRNVPVTQGAVTASVSASGTVASSSTANAAFSTSGTVTEIAVAVGDTVKKGQVLAKVDATLSNAQLATAKANLTAAEASLDRANSADDPDDAAIAQAEAQVTQAEANVTQARQAVAGTVLKAPIAGTVIAVNGSLGGSSSGSGSSGSSGQSGGSSGFVQLADLTRMQVSAGFAEADATKLKAGQQATVTWNALTGARASGTVRSVAPTATTQNNVNSYSVVVALDTVPDGARIGQTTTVVVTVGEVANAVRVPAAAVHGGGGQRYVDVVDASGGTTQRTVQVGLTGDGFVEIKSGLTAGEQVRITTNTSTTTNTNNFPNGGFIGGFNGGGPGVGGGR